MSEWRPVSHLLETGAVTFNILIGQFLIFFHKFRKKKNHLSFKQQPEVKSKTILAVIK